VRDGCCSDDSEKCEGTAHRGVLAHSQVSPLSEDSTSRSCWDDFAQLKERRTEIPYVMNDDSGNTGRAARDTGELTLEIERQAAGGPWTIEVGSSRGIARTVMRRGQRLILGTARDVDIRLEDPCVSAEHCVLDASEGFAVTDLSSRNGLYVGNARVKSAQLESDNFAFVIGRTTVVVRCGENRLGARNFEQIPGMIGSSEPMVRVAATIRKHATQRAPILLLGESGVGKDVAARAIHALSGRIGDYLPINVSTIAETLADSELFGHLKGAFTGAVASRNGAFAAAHKGTILLDEIGELPLPIQAKLLRIVEDGCVRPVGATKTQTVDVRIISATWAPLLERALQGKFRFDLLQRLSTVVIEIPPLRKRRSDIPALVTNWLRLKEGELGSKLLTSAAMARLVAHDWPGNVRELAAVLYRACIGAEGLEVDWIHIDEGLQASLSISSRPRVNHKELLCRCDGNVSMAARAAGLPRSTLRSRLEKTKGIVSDLEVKRK
jgi:pSer/pThr/pTyr-binding forkhead associated (FHA) protein